MRILMIGEYKPRVEGPANVVINLSSQLSKDHDVSVVCFENPSYPRVPGHWMDGDVDVWQERIIRPNTLVFLQGILQKFKRAYLLRNKVDLYHAHGYLDALIGLLDRSKPLILTYHGLPIPESLAAGWLKEGTLELRVHQALEMAVLKRADAIIVPNNQMKGWLTSKQKVPYDKIFVVPNGVDVLRFNHKSNIILSDLPRGRKTLIFVKRLNEQSGVRYLLQSMLKIKERFPEVQLILLGDGPLKEELKATAGNLGILDNVLFIGRVQNDLVPSYLNFADIFVLPSIPQGDAEETFGISLIEAMACKKAVIASSIGGPKEILSAEIDLGILVPPKDPDAIANAVIHLFEDPSLISTLGENARRFVESTFTWEGVTLKTLEIYGYALAKNRSG